MGARRGGCPAAGGAREVRSGGAYPRGANLGDEEDGDAETGAEADEGGDADRNGLLVKLGELGELDSLRQRVKLAEGASP